MKTTLNRTLLIIGFSIFVSFCNAQVPQLEWVVSWGGSYYDYGYSVKIDSEGYIYMSGVFYPPIDLDPGTNTILYEDPNNINNSHFFVQKYHEDGTLIWVKTFGTQASNGVAAYSMSIDNSDNIYLTGEFWGSTDFDPGPDVFTLSPLGNDDIFLLKLNSDGEFIWAKQSGGNSYDTGGGVTIDKLNNLIVVGTFSATADFDPGPDEHLITSPIGTSGFAQKLDSAGNFIWAKRLGRRVQTVPMHQHLQLMKSFCISTMKTVSEFGCKCFSGMHLIALIQ